jgi:hypothetical protein
MVGLVVAWRVFPVIVGPIFDAVLKALYPTLRWVPS